MSIFPQLQKESPVQDALSASLANYRMKALGGRKIRTRQTFPEDGLRRTATLEHDLLTCKFGPKTPLLFPAGLPPLDITPQSVTSFSERFSLQRERGVSMGEGKDGREVKTVSLFAPEETKEKPVQKGVELADFASRLKGNAAAMVFCSKSLGEGHRPETREGCTLTAVEGKLYLFGGRCRKLFNDIKVLDPMTLRWEEPALQSTIGGLPEPRVNHTTVMFENSLVVYGGCERFNDILQIRNCFHLVHFYDTRKTHLGLNSWSSAKPAGRGPEPRRCHCAVVVGKLMVLFGGMDRVGKVLDDLQGLNLGKLHTETMAWTVPLLYKRTTRPGPRTGATFTTVFSPDALRLPTMDLFQPPKAYDDVFTPTTCGLYLIGGANEKGVCCNDVYVLRGKKMSVRDDRPSLIWVKADLGGTPPEPRYDHSACLCGKFIYIYGGRDNSRFNTTSHCEVKSFAALNIESQRWDRIDLVGMSPSGRWSFAMAAMDSRLYIFGGMKLAKFCSSKLNVVETNEGVVREKVSQMKAIKKSLNKSRSMVKFKNVLPPKRVGTIS